MKQRALVVAVVAFVIVGCGGKSGVTGAGNVRDTSLGPGLKRSTNALALPVPRTFDLSHVKPAHFAVALGKDPGRIFEFVRDEIAFEPYAGALRGARGTLMARAGNSIDRATLLAALLETSGFQVRYARGSLPEEKARQLVDSIWATRIVPLTKSSTSTEAVDKVVANIERDSRLLLTSLKAAGLSSKDQTSVRVETLVQNTRNHYWIEYWKDDGWIAMDASFRDAVVGQANAAVQETVERLPDDLFHRVDVRVHVEEQSGTDQTDRTLLEFAATAAELSGADLMLRHAPVDPREKRPSDVKPLLVIGSRLVTGEAFGLTAPMTPRSTMADAFGGGADAPAIATAEFIDIEFTSPQGQKETVVRTIFDRLGPYRRHAGGTSPEWIADSVKTISLDDFISSTYLMFVTTGAVDFEHITNLADTPARSENEPYDIGAALRRICVAFTSLSDAITSSLPGSSGSVWRTFLDTPRVQIAEFVPSERALRFGIDLRRDPGLTIASDSSPEQAFRARVVRGVINGTLERFVIEQATHRSDGQPWPGQLPLSTSSLFERVDLNKSHIRLLRQDASALDVTVPADARQRITEAMASGLLVLTPTTAVDLAGTPRMAWWQVDPRSGATIAVTDEGLHQTQVELSIKQIDNDRFWVVHHLPNQRNVVVPRNGNLFNSGAEAEEYCESLLRVLGDRKIKGTWGWVD